MQSSVHRFGANFDAAAALVVFCGIWERRQWQRRRRRTKTRTDAHTFSPQSALALPSLPAALLPVYQLLPDTRADHGPRAAGRLPLALLSGQMTSLALLLAGAAAALPQQVEW